MDDALLQVSLLPGVQDACDTARKAVDRLRGHRVLRRKSTEVSTESLLRGARASAALEGAPAHLEEVRSGKATHPLVQGALRISGEMGPLGATWKTAPRQVLARLHVLAARDAVPAERLGRPRDEGTPTPAEVAARLDILSDLLTARSTAPAIVVAAIVHGELLALRPFGEADGLVARAASRLTLIDRGLDPKALVAPDVGHLEFEKEYRETFEGYLTGSAEGVAAWIRHCAEAVAFGARDSQTLCEAIERG
ncbi:oxidoreductase [Actinocorallia sp. API 0066]|uniref:oxidoreductase n=1 Tax=Actinocorallia sp. API 0066 TaxID=2896846 RepID=UPI001E5F4C53|nr:oxidoreductase [Actinocorallia sp. API 0066]MCD0450623.1 oxidoreductase [Actinocorallia sp. API 0066]